MNQPIYRFLLFSLVLILGLILIGEHYGSDVDDTPCSPGGFPSRCYNISPKMCIAVWSTTDENCKAYIKKFDLPPGRLVGPIVFRCQWAYLDSAFSGARKATPECQEMFTELKDWESRNDFK